MQKTRLGKKGKIIPNGVVLQPHEWKTVVLLAELGYDIELVPKSNKRGAKSPDLKIGELYWEMKAPKGSGKFLIQNTLHKAVQQSPNIIINLRRVKIPQAQCLAKIKKEFELTKHYKNIKVITKPKNIIDFTR